MPGVRIRPVADRVVPDNSLIVLRILDKPITPPRNGQRLEDVRAVCSKCGIQHFEKTFHLQLEAGSVIVSEKVWENMQLLPDHGGFEYVNPVQQPPSQGISLEGR